MIITKENIACLILNPEKKFLLIQRAPKDDSLPGFWELPSGGIDEGSGSVYMLMTFFLRVSISSAR